MRTPKQRERWCGIPGFPGYEVSSLGRVRGVLKVRGKVPGRLLKLRQQGSTWVVSLPAARGAPVHSVRRLVAVAFLEPKPDPRHVLDHLDGNYLNCTAANLMWRPPTWLSRARQGTRIALRDYTCGALPGEEWRPVVGYMGVEASSLGRVRLHRQDPAGREYTKVLKPTFMHGRKKYLSVKPEKYHCRRVHKLVAETFLGPCPEGYETHHRNQDKLDNRISNLEYLPRSHHRHLHHPKLT